MTRPFFDRLPEMRYRSIRIALLEQGCSNVGLRVRIVGRNPDGGLEMVHCLSHSTSLNQRLTEIVVVFTLVGPELECFPEITSRFIDVATFGQKRSEIAVRHPAIRIACDRRPPKRFDVAIVTTLAP